MQDVNEIRNFIKANISKEESSEKNELLQSMVERLDELENDFQQDTKDAEGLLPDFIVDWFYDDLEIGNFKGKLLLSWSGVDDDSNDQFLFLVDKNNPFEYTTTYRDESIKPQCMYTDGGSIPRLLRCFEQFSPWRYGPAFIIHDWLFEAKKCNFAPDNAFSFQDTAYIMAEAMKTLMEVGIEVEYENGATKTIKLDKSADTLLLMFLAVSSFVAKNKWEKNDCNNPCK